MEIKNIFFITILFIVFTSNAQIEKGNWMMGGSGSFGNYKITNKDDSFSSTQIGINPNIGYFIIDKLAFGALVQVNFSFYTQGNPTYSSNAISPFVRYYFLENDKTINIFSQGSYEILRINHNEVKQDKFKLKAGAVFFLNSSVGIEVALNYSKQKTNQDYENRAIYLDVGFQIHLEKE